MSLNDFQEQCVSFLKSSFDRSPSSIQVIEIDEPRGYCNIEAIQEWLRTWAEVVETAPCEHAVRLNLSPETTVSMAQILTETLTLLVNGRHSNSREVSDKELTPLLIDTPIDGPPVVRLSALDHVDVTQVREQWRKVRSRYTQITQEEPIKYDDTIAIGYILGSVLVHAQLIHCVLCRLAATDTSRGSLMPANAQGWTVCVLGGGSGAECIGITLFVLSAMLLKASVIPVRFNLVFNVYDYSESWAMSLRCISTALCNYAQRMTQDTSLTVHIEINFLCIDLLRTDSQATISSCICRADLTVMCYAFGEMRMADPKGSDTLLISIFQGLRTGCHFLILDPVSLHSYDGHERAFDAHVQTNTFVTPVQRFQYKISISAQSLHGTSLQTLAKAFNFKLGGDLKLASNAWGCLLGRDDNSVPILNPPLQSLSPEVPPVCRRLVVFVPQVSKSWRAFGSCFRWPSVVELDSKLTHRGYRTDLIDQLGKSLEDWLAVGGIALCDYSTLVNLQRAAKDSMFRQIYRMLTEADLALCDDFQYLERRLGSKSTFLLTLLNGIPSIIRNKTDALCHEFLEQSHVPVANPGKAICPTTRDSSDAVAVLCRPYAELMTFLSGRGVTFSLQVIAESRLTHILRAHLDKTHKVLVFCPKACLSRLQQLLEPLSEVLASQGGALYMKLSKTGTETRESRRCRTGEWSLCQVTLDIAAEALPLFDVGPTVGVWYGLDHVSVNLTKVKSSQYQLLNVRVKPGKIRGYEIYCYGKR